MSGSQSTPSASGRPATPRPDDQALPTASGLYRGAAAAALAVFRAQQWRITQHNLDLLPSDGGAVLVANHMSFWDFFTVAMGPYLQLDRPVRILAKQSLFDAPAFGRVMREAGHIPVQRGRGVNAYAAAVAALQSGELILVLPEATISPAFELLGFKSGAARMAMAAGVPLVPAISWGSHRFHTVQRRPTPRWRLPVTVTWGAPTRPAPDDSARTLTDAVRSTMQAMFDAAVVSYPDGTPPGAWWVPARFGGGAPTPEQADAYLASIRERWR